MISAGGPGKWEHANLARESKDNLGRRGVDLCGKSSDGGMPEDLPVCGEKREALVDDVALAAKCAYLAVPSANRVASVLDKSRPFRMGPGHLLQLSKRNVADAEKACASGIAFFDHGLPGFKIVCGPVGVRSGAVENKAVDVVSAEMLERTGHRLRDLNGKSCGRIVWEAMVLPILIGELGLKENVGARDEACGIGGRQTLADTSFKVVLTLVGCVDPAKSRAYSKFGEGWGAVFFPGGAVEEIGNGRGLDVGHHLYSHMRRDRGCVSQCARRSHNKGRKRWFTRLRN